MAVFRSRERLRRYLGSEGVPLFGAKLMIKGTLNPDEWVYIFTLSTLNLAREGLGLRILARVSWIMDLEGPKKAK